MKIDFIGLGLLAVGLGFLQIVLDKGQRDDWFGSPFIVWGTVISAVALIGLIVRELVVENPVVDVHLFRDRNFAISTFMMYTLGFVLYGTTLLLPILMQTLMGYTAMESGMVLLPGGLLLLGILPFVGILLSKVRVRDGSYLMRTRRGDGNRDLFSSFLHLNSMRAAGRWCLTGRSRAD